MSLPQVQEMAVPVSQILRNFIDAHREKGATIGEMVHFFGDRGFGFLMMIFSLICIIPLPIPGIHMFLSIPLFYLSLQQFAGRHEVWFPDKVTKYTIPARALVDVGLKTVPWIEKIEGLSKPRLSYLAEGWWFRFFGGVAFYITAFLSIPLPLTNLVPAVGLVFMAIGILMKDGLAIIIGSIIGVVWSILWFIVGFTGLFLLGKQVIALVF
jgi:hypothetical protein